MIIDDSEPFRIALSVLLKQFGYETIISEKSGQDALQTFNFLQNQPEQTIDAILLDLNMPEMDGIAVIKNIKANHRLCGIPILVISADSEDVRISQAFEAGAQDYIRKPIQKMELEARVRTVLELKRESDSRKRREHDLELTVLQLNKALNEIKTLSGLLPICSHCKKIRDDKGYWTRVEQYIMDRSKAEFTHGVCPECVQKYYATVNIGLSESIEV
jgi:DNA-binding response OmpR family regulator